MVFRDHQSDYRRPAWTLRLAAALSLDCIKEEVINRRIKCQRQQVFLWSMETDKSLEQERRQDTIERLHWHHSLAVAPSTGFVSTSLIHGSSLYIVLIHCSTPAQTEMIPVKLCILCNAVPVSLLRCLVLIQSCITGMQKTLSSYYRNILYIL